MESKMPKYTTFERILFCTDFSENSDYAFFFALDAAQRRPDSELYLLHVVPESESQFWKTYIYEVEGVDDKAKQDIDDHIRRAYLSHLPEYMELKKEFRVGKDWQEILAFAKERRIDLIVMGRQGKSTLEKTFFGNVTEKIVRKAECAVLVVPLSYQKTHEG